MSDAVMSDSVVSYRAHAEACSGMYFDHLGARQLSADFQIWLSLRAADGQMVRITMIIDRSTTIPSVADLWAGAEWCEREVSEGFSLEFDQKTEPLLVDQQSRGYLLKDRSLPARSKQWPGSFDPAGKSIKPIGVN